MDIDDLTAKLAVTTSLTAAPWLFQPLLLLLAQGDPVAAEDLAEVTGRPTSEVHQTLAALPDVQTDPHGRVTGYGLTLEPTPHRFEVDGHQLYTWCALDTLIFPAILGTSARVESPCHSTGRPVQVNVEPDRVASVDPDAAVVSIVTPTRGQQAGIRSAFCNHVHFFTSAKAAEGWLDDHPGMSIHPVAEAQRLGRPLVEALLSSDGPDPRCY